jgi:hypothetical protein
MRQQNCVRRVVSVLTLASFLSACYRERPLASPAPVPTSRIIAQLTDTGAVVMAGSIGVAATEVEGIVAEADANVWKLHMVRVTQRGGGSTRWNREVVSFPRYALSNAREKGLDKRRSWIVAGLITAAVVAASLLFGGAITGGDGPVDPVPPV